jgi:hypothetical protein
MSLLHRLLWGSNEISHKKPLAQIPALKKNSVIFVLPSLSPPSPSSSSSPSQSFWLSSKSRWITCYVGSSLLMVALPPRLALPSQLQYDQLLPRLLPLSPPHFPSSGCPNVRNLLSSPSSELSPLRQRDQNKEIRERKKGPSWGPDTELGVLHHSTFISYHLSLYIEPNGYCGSVNLQRTGGHTENQAESQSSCSYIPGGDRQQTGTCVPSGQCDRLGGEVKGMRGQGECYSWMGVREDLSIWWHLYGKPEGSEQVS